MSLEKTPVISPYEKNAKKHTEKQLTDLANMVKEVGWRQPVLVNKNGVIVVGHGRYEAWRKFKDELPPIWIMNDSGEILHGGPSTTPMTEEQEKAYRIADNKLNESPWDTDLLVSELREINLEGEIDIALTGFDVGFITDNFNYRNTSTELDFDEDEEKKSKQKSCPNCGYEL